MDLPMPSREDMGPRGRRAWDVLRAIYHEAEVENLPFMAGSIAYHAFVSLLPLIVLLLFLVTSLADASLSERILAVIEIVLTPSGRELVTDAITTNERSSSLSVLGGVVLLWTVLRIFRGLDQAFSDIYETEERNTLVDQLVDGFVVMVTIVAAVFLAGLVRTVVEFGPSFLGKFLQTAFVVLGLALALLPMYYVFPDADVSVQGAIPGTLFAAGGITTLESLFRLYVAVGGANRSYGILGAILVLLTWLYLVGFVILLGAVINAVLTNRSEDVDIEPVIGDWRPGIGRTFGPSAWGNPEREVVATRIQSLRERLDGETPLTVTVGHTEIRLPPPASIELDAERDENDEVGIRIEW